MKLFALLALAASSLSAFAAAPTEPPAYQGYCIVITTGPKGSDINHLVQQSVSLNAGESLELYKNGDVSYFVQVHKRTASDGGTSYSLLLGINRPATLEAIAFAGADYTDELPRSIKVLGPNLTAIPGPPNSLIQCFVF